MPAKTKAFEAWYEENWLEDFCLRDEVEKYCMQDVKILTHGVVKFRELYMKVTDKDIIAENMTIASACLDHFVTRYMKEEEVAIIPDNGYNKMDRQSAIALKYLKWRAFSDSLHIQHRDSPQGEARLKVGHKTYKLDGLVHGSTPYCIEFNGNSRGFTWPLPL
jgi:hypothetical protein